MTDESWLAMLEHDPETIAAAAIVRQALKGRPKPLHVQRASKADRWDLLRWRNDPQTRAMFRSGELVLVNRHLAWLREQLTRADSRLYVVYETRTPAKAKIGTFRLDLERDGVYVSLTIAPEYRGLGFATPLIQAIQDASRDFGWPLIAEVKPENTACLRAFRRAGWEERIDASPDGLRRFMALVCPDLHYAVHVPETLLGRLWVRVRCCWIWGHDDVCCGSNSFHGIPPTYSCRWCGRVRRRAPVYADWKKLGESGP